MIGEPLAPFRRRAIAPIARRDRMIGIERLQIGTHLSQPCPALSPTSSQALRFVHQFVTKDGWIVAIHYAADGVTPRRNSLDVLAIKAAGSLVRIKQHRLFFVYAVRIFVVIGADDAGPAEVLRHAARVAPPVCQTELHAQSVTLGFGDDTVEKDKLLFVPFARLETKIMCARPIVKVADRLNVIRSAFTCGPNA